MEVKYKSSNDKGELVYLKRAVYYVKNDKNCFSKLKKEDFTVDDNELLKFIETCSIRNGVFDAHIEILHYFIMCLQKGNKIQTFKNKIKPIFDEKIQDDLVMAYGLIDDRFGFMNLLSERVSVCNPGNFMIQRKYYEYMFGKICVNNIFQDGFSKLITKTLINLNDHMVVKDVSLVDCYVDSIIEVFSMCNEIIVENNFISNDEMLCVIKKLKEIEFMDNLRIFGCLYNELYYLASCSPRCYEQVYTQYIQCFENIKLGNVPEYNCVVFDETKHESECDICMEPYRKGGFVCMIHPSTCDKHMVCGFCARQIKNCPFCRCDIEKKINI